MHATRSNPLFQDLTHAVIGLILGAACALIGLLAAASGAHAAGLMSPSDGSQTALAIKHHQVRVVIEDGYAVTTIEQVFHNPHATDLEAVYSFPVPDQASVSEFTYWIDGQPVRGEVLPKRQARQAYQEEKAAGREAGLTEQDSHKTFEVSVWPVRAGQDVRIRLGYIQPTAIDTGIGRYVYPLEDGGVDEQKLAFWTAEDRVTGRFEFDLVLRSATPVEAVRLPSHPQAVAAKADDGTWRIHMGNDAGLGAAPDDADAVTPAAVQAGAPFRLDTDLVVYWRLRQGLPGSVEMLVHKPAADKRGTYMLVLTPGDDLAPIGQGGDWVFVLDKSGSMKAKFATLLEGVSRGLNRLRPTDRFRIVLFDRSAIELTGPLAAATPDNVRAAISKLGAITPGHGTNLHAGLERGLEGLDADRTSVVFLVTDGVANVGETSRRAFLDLVRGKDVRLFTFVMGNSANRPLLQAMTRESGGTAFSVSNSDDIVGAVLSATDKVTHQALHGVTVEITGPRTADQTPAKPGSLYRGQQLVLFGHYWGDGPAEVTLSGRISGRPTTYRTEFAFPAVATGNPELERLWAFAAIEERMQEIEDFGETADHRQAVVDLAVEHGLVTPYTSMLVLRDEAFAARGIARRNNQRLAVEAAAQTRRGAQPVQSRRVDTAQPMFKTARPSYGGGGGGSGGGGAGALGLADLILVLVLAAAVLTLAGRRPAR